MYLEHSKEELEIVKGWKTFVRGDFFIERILRNYVIFIQGKKVYRVSPLNTPFEDIVPFLPFYVRTVLLPFKGKIVYDGLLEGYNIYIGGGIKAQLKEVYMVAKQQGRIITRLDERKQRRAPARPRKDWGPLLTDLAQRAKKLHSSTGAPAIYSPAFSLVKTSIDFAKTATENPDDIEQLRKAYKRVERAMRRVATTLDRLEYFEMDEDEFG